MRLTGLVICIQKKQRFDQPFLLRLPAYVHALCQPDSAHDSAGVDADQIDDRFHQITSSKYNYTI
jgi:hypothetical protein